MKLLFAIAAALLICGTARAQTTDGAQRTITATIVDGAVTVQRGDGTSQILRGGTSLREGDVIQTGADSRVEMSLSDGSTLRLGENAKFEVRVSPPSGRIFTARLWLGEVWAKVHKLLQDEAFQVETENAVAGVRGTEFTVAAGGAGDNSVRVYSGTVEVRDHAGQWAHRVEGGRELSFRRGLLPEGPKPFDPASDRENKLMRWVREQPSRTDDPADRLRRRSTDREKRERPERRNRLFERRER
jgi:hypothetical protein